MDEIVAEYLSRHGFTTERTYLSGYLRSLGLRVQRRRVRESLIMVDPQNTALRWGVVIARRQYSVPWSNSLCNLDSHHSLIRRGLVVHGCIDGFSRRIMFLKCSNNNLSQNVLELFLNAVDKDGLWPSRIRVHHGVESNVVVRPVNLPGDNQLIRSSVEHRINPLMPSTEMGIDIFIFLFVHA